MNHSITTKLAAVVFAVLMNGLVLGSVSYLFAPPATAMSQPVDRIPAMSHAPRGVA